jgi:HlyD family secretion protein
MLKIYVPLTLACVLVLSACSGSAKQGGEKGQEAAAEAATPVQVETAKREPIQHLITAEAVLYPISQANVMPKISAPVKRFLVNRGDHVRKDQVLALLEDADLTATARESAGLYEQAQAAYKTTTAATLPDDLTKATTDVQSAQQALDAAKKLYENRQVLFHQGALAQKLVDDAKVALVQAQSQYETAQRHLNSLQTVGRNEQVASAQAQVDAAKAHLENAQAQVAYAEIRSPIGGIVSDRPLNIGEIASSGSAVMTVVDISSVIARANVPVHEAAEIRVGKPAKISGPGAELNGKVTVVSPAVDANTTTVQVWVQARNSGEQLKPGTTVQISVDADEIPNAIVVPSAALLSLEEGGEKVMIAGGDGTAHERKVEVGVRQGDRVQILKGVKEGERVITVGGLGLEDKAKIEIAKPGDEGAPEKEADKAGDAGK